MKTSTYLYSASLFFMALASLHFMATGSAVFFAGFVWCGLFGTLAKIVESS